jgi:hypothetical protein
MTVRACDHCTEDADHAERLYEQADMERKRRREESAA